MGEMPHIDSRTRRAVMKGEKMKKKLLAGILAVSMVGALLTGCGKGAAQNTDTAGTQEASEASEPANQAPRRERKPMRS